MNLTKKEFDKLKNEFVKRVLVRKDIYLKTNPQELAAYYKFIEKNAPFDCIIDGLNVAYSTGNMKKPETYSNLVRLFA